MIEQRNSFSENTRQLFEDNHKCWWCGKNNARTLHHIVGRGGKSGEVEDSPLNAAPIHNHNCHINIHPVLMTDEVQKRFALKTYDYITTNGYQLTEKDADFIQKYIYLYE